MPLGEVTPATLCVWMRSQAERGRRRTTPGRKFALVTRRQLIQAAPSPRQVSTSGRGSAQSRVGLQIELQPSLADHVRSRPISDLDVASLQSYCDAFQLPCRHAKKDLATQIGEPAALLDAVREFSQCGVKAESAGQMTARETKAVELRTSVQIASNTWRLLHPASRSARKRQRTIARQRTLRCFGAQFPQSLPESLNATADGQCSSRRNA